MKDMVGNKFMKLKNELHIGKNDIIAMGLMLLALLILMQYRTYRPFLDESDNFLGGKILSRGGVIYKDYTFTHFYAKKIIYPNICRGCITLLELL